MKASLKKLSPHYSIIFKLGLPIAVGQLGVIILGFADTTMVGRYGTEPLAAASFVNNLFTLVTFVLMGYSYGLTPIVSSLYAQGEYAKAAGKFKDALVANSLFAVIVLGIMLALYPFLDKMGQAPSLLPLIRPYYIVILISMVFVMLFNVLRQFTDGLSDTKIGMYALMIGNGANILGNWLLIYGVGPFPEMGLLGAGVATLASRILMVVIMILALWWKRKYAPFREGFALHEMSNSSIREMNAASLPISIQMGVESAAFALSAVMAGWISKEALAAYQIIVTIGTLGFLFYYSFGASTSIRVANFIGNKDWLGVRNTAKAGTLLLIMIAVLSSTVMYFFSGPMIHIFTTDATVIQIGMSLIPLLIFYQFADAMQICYANILRGTGRVMSMMRIAIISYVIIGLPAAYILSFVLGMGVQGILLAISLGLFTAAGLFLWEYHKISKTKFRGTSVNER